VLRIPEPDKKKKNKDDPQSTAFYDYKVGQGETVYSIAMKTGVSEMEINRNNPEIKKDGLKSGQVIKIPGTAPVVVPEVKKEVIVTQDPLKKDSIVADPNENDFEVAFFLPFYLSTIPYIEVEKIRKGLADFPEKSRIAIEFYQGALIALDSLKAKGVSVHVHIFDTGSDSTGIVDLTQFPELKKMNLIIGPLYTNSFIAMSKFAKEHSIPIVSPLSQNNKILLGNIMVSKSTPSIITQLEQLSDYIGKTYFDQNLILLGSANPKEQNYTNTVKQIVNDAMKTHDRSDSVISAMSIKNISENLRPDRINVIIITNTNPSNVTDLLSKLNKLREDSKGKDSLIVFGMSAWSGIESIDIEYLNNLNVHLPSPVFTDYGMARVKNFIEGYRNTYHTDPSDYVFEGFDVTHYYVSALKHTGKKAMQSSLPDQKWSGLHTDFDLYQSSVESGYENKRVFVLRYDHYQLVKVN
jgi:ABC-type branched-subunit amino acid transport system substrate-binding protein/LysM repeat protein